MTVPSILVDKRSINQHFNALGDAISKSSFIGLDCETQDSARHAGLTRRCGYDDEGFKKKGKPLIFDHRRTALCGVSFYSEQMPGAYYLNIGHADVENQLPKEQLKELLAAKSDTAYWLAHNAPFEITTFANTLGWELPPKIICTLQMAVSAYGPHEFPMSKWYEIGQGGIAKLMPAIMAQMHGLNLDTMEMTPALSELVYKIIAKESDADHSYNGLIDSIAYGYGLKQCVRSHFGHQMSTFAETLGEDAHMGQKTGDEVVEYGAEDAYWAFRLFHHLLGYMGGHGGEALVNCFLEQENPMAAVYSSIARGGMKVDTSAITERRELERHEFATTLRNLKTVVREMLPFPDAPHEGLVKHDAWYAKGHAKYRNKVLTWAFLPDVDDDYEQCQQVRGPISNAWATDLGKPESDGLNLAHYMPVRTLIYDLTGTKVIVSQGKTQSDGEARGRLKDRFDKLDEKLNSKLIEGLNKIAGVEQRMKLYLTPYSQLIDPETNRMYPTVNSLLATRRMASSEPNGMQLAKRGESVFVRSYYVPDYDDHVLISEDWSAIELVEIGEFSGDPEFIKAFGQLPHEDLHSGAAAAILAVEAPGLNEDIFKSLKRLSSWEEFKADVENPARLWTDLKGQKMDPKTAVKYWRTEVGKGANFNYWYSGWLATIGERMGWSQDKVAEATDRYAQRFSVAEAWRRGIIDEVTQSGYVTLPDGHRYVRYEATAAFMGDWRSKFLTSIGSTREYEAIINWIGRKIAKRAGNQTVNALIQGSCATIAKRSILRILTEAKARGWTEREFRFVLPIHDELLFSVHRSIAVEAMHLIRNIMIDHPDMFKLCKLDASPSIGLNFQPWKPKARLGQVEIFEPPADIVGEERADKRLDDDGVATVVDWLFRERERLAA